MADQATGNHSVLPEMHEFAEQGVEHARKAFDDLMAATQQAISTFEDQTHAAQAAAREVQQHAMGFAERNIAASFQFARNLVRAQTAEEIAKLHAEFVTEQMQSLAGQARELADNAGKAASREAG